MSILISFLTEVLFFTNLWIIIFTKSIDYLNFLFPSHINEIFYRNPLANPEPFEISLYLFLSMIFLSTIFLRLSLQNRLKIPILNTTVKFLISLLLLLLLVSKLGNFPLAGDIISYHLQPNRQVYTFIFFLYLAFIAFLIFEFFLLQKIIGGKKIGSFVIYVPVALLIGIAIFDPQFPLSPADSALFYGPIWEVAHGKTLFTNIPSQYGFLSVLFFSIFYKFTHIKFLYLPIFIWLLYIFEYLICFYLILKISKSIAFSLLGLFSILTINYFAATYGPQASPLRWFPIFLLLFLIYRLKDATAKLILFLLPILALWNIDSGIALVCGYLFTLFLFFLTRRLGFKKLILTVIYLFLTTSVILGLIQTIHLIIGMPMINFLAVFHSLNKYAGIGFGMVPMEPHTYFWLFILLYFASVMYFFRNSANLMFFASIYYVGRSMAHELFTISIFAILTFFLLAGLAYRDIVSSKIRLFIFILLFFSLITFPTFERKEFIGEKILGKYHGFSGGIIFTSKIDEDLQKN